MRSQWRKPFNGCRPQALASKLTAAAAALLALGPSGQTQAVAPRDFAVELSARVRALPTQIRLEWVPVPGVTRYRVSRKLIQDGGWTELAQLPADRASYTDSSVVLGGAYEYEVASQSPDGLVAYGYLYAGVQVPFPTWRGRVILVVDNTHASELAPELERLTQDLTGDGWTVLRHDVSRSATPEEVKHLIRADYQADPANTRTVFLFGHVPVPYSGAISPDMHAGHLGAWPADVFYGDMEGGWTDDAVQATDAEDPRNHNVPGDGKFDQSHVPGRVVLQVGRVDMADMPAFGPQTEAALLRQYLDKNHRFRHGLLRAESRGLIRDNFGEIQGDAPATDAWRSFTAFFGPGNVHEVGPGEFFPVLAAQSYLWAYGGGGGDYFHADGVGSTTDFAQRQPRTVFLLLHGSYFGDWDSSDNFLRAALASPGYGLAAAWTGLPHWFFHHMALGEPIGRSTLAVQNNRDLYRNQVNLSAGQVHVALMGDPTLRMHVVASPAWLTAEAAQDGSVTLNWGHTPDAVEGSYVYRADSPSGPFARLTRSWVTGGSFTDRSAPGGWRMYMVRAVRLETSASGSYYNPSQGIFATVEASGGGGQNEPPVLSTIEDQTLLQGATRHPIPLSVSDEQTPAAELVVTASSSSVELVPPDGLFIEGTGADRTLFVTPAPGKAGRGVITLSVSDGRHSTSRAFNLLVTGGSEIRSIVRGEGGSVAIEFAGLPGRPFTVRVSKDLLEWTDLRTGTTDGSPTTLFLDTSVTNACRFYRVEWR